MSDETRSVLRKWKRCLAHRSWHLQSLERADIELDQTHREGQHVSSTSGSCPQMDRCPVHPGYACCVIVCHARTAQTRMSPRLSFSVEQTEVQVKHGGHPRHRLPLQRATSTLVDPLETGKEAGERPQSGDERHASAEAGSQRTGARAQSRRRQTKMRRHDPLLLLQLQRRAVGTRRQPAVPWQRHWADNTISVRQEGCKNCAWP